MKQKFLNIIIYGISLAAVFLLLRWTEWRFLVLSPSIEVYVSVVAILFMLLGIWLAIKLFQPKPTTRVQTVVVEKEVLVEKEPDEGNINEAAREELGLSNREIEVLELMARGLSNQEIASQLFVSLNTVKTHSSRVFEKMEVKRRTQAVEKARRLQIIL